MSPRGGWGSRAGSQPYTQWGTFSQTCLQWEMGEERRISFIYIYTMGNIQSDMSLVTDGGGEDLCYVHSGGHSVTHVPKRGMGE